MKETGRKIFLTGLIIFLIFYSLPIDIFNGFTNLKPTGFSSMILCPIIGIIGIIFSIKEKDKLFVVLNLLLILLLPLAMFAGHIIGL